ncbi:GATA zinc finger domain-containing protein 7-like isoform X2 [Cotesia glomerata]|uniref:GATA zinc finger domain-containing protein 7-like isoform X2 n=1 Tax=Cotesia glomerata TaxID=32391 RepID=UPI001D0029C0|nr:GATA zinc finger domain-containing protein 7-like isoform X2 [Cotesia glomerata]
MAPGPDNRQDLTSLDQNQQESNDCSVINDTTDVAAEISPKDVSSVVKSYHSMIASVGKLEEPATLSTLNERELRALLDEAITYTGSTKDREGKSNLFKELLQEAEVDETEEGRRAVTSSRGLPGSNRRRHKRDSTCERLTHGGSLQNLAQPLNCEFDSSFTYLTSGSSHTYSGSRRKSKKHSGSNVSARQREGGSLPSNVNASHSLASLVNLDLIFDKKRDFCDERTVYYWANKEKSRSLDKPSYGCVTKKDDSVCTTVDASDVNDKKCPKGKYVTNEMIESDDLSSSYKDDSMVNGLNNKDAVSSNNLINSPRIIQSSVNGEDTEGIEMKIIEPRRPVQVISCPTFDTEETSVDSSIEFPLHEYNCKQDKPKFTINGTIQLTTYNNAKCNVTSGTISGVQQNKVTTSNLLPIMHVTGTQPNIAMVSRLTSQNNTTKDFSVSIDKKSVDDSYNAAQSYNSERKKTRRKHAQEPNVIVYNAENVAGHRNDDIDSLLNFIESKDSKNKKGKTPNGNTIKIKSNTGPKSRSKDKDSKKDQLPSKLQKCNSLEEISKTRLEDLTTEKSLSSSEASSFSSQHGTINGGLLKRTKQRSTGDSVVDSHGDRHSWGSESQSLYCDDVKNEFSSNNSSTRKNSKKLNIDVEPEPEFLVVTKKKKSKRQRRSSSGSRTQNLVNSSSYLSRRRDFVHEYRASHSPEFRRKSACSVPPSDKSDSSDLDSVHSLPVTSNIKHNLINVSLSSVGVPQASYADITRMVTINLPQNSVLHTSPIVPTILSAEKWTDVPAKSPSEPDKFPQHYYPSLDELQQSDRKIKQHNFSNSYLNHGFSLNFDKHSLTDDLKLKKTTESKKAEAHEEAINKKIQVIKYVQEQNNIPVNTNYNADQNDVHTTKKLKNYNNNSIEQSKTSVSCVRDVTNTTNANISNNFKPSIRKNSQQTLLNTSCSNRLESRDLKKSSNVQEELKSLNTQHNPEYSKKLINLNASECSFTLSNDQLDSKSIPQPNSSECDNFKPVIKSEKILKLVNKDYPRNTKVTTTITTSNSIRSSSMTSSLQHEKEDVETKETNKHHVITKDKDLPKCNSHNSVKKNSRPAVILMDESLSDSTKNKDDVPSELTFGFEINEQLLQSEDRTKKDQPILPSKPSQSSNKVPIHFEKTPPSFVDKNTRYDFHVHPPPHLYPPQPHQIPHTQMIPITYFGYSPRFQPPNNYVSQPLIAPSNAITKYNLSKEDFSARFIAPEETVDVKNYNHDKIVSFVGLAWDAVMREIPVTEATGRVQYYSGQ